MRYYIALFCLLVLQSCKTNDDIICDGDPIPLRIIFINLVDMNGNNLIENGTFDSDEIEVSFNGYSNTSPFFVNNPELENLIAVTVTGIVGNNAYEIKLSSSITDTLLLNLDSETLGTGPCSGTYFTINSASYNNVTQTVEDLNNWSYLITVFK